MKKESGSDYKYEKFAHPTCPECEGLGEIHDPYEDYDTYLIRRCDCTRRTRDRYTTMLREKALEK